MTFATMMLIALLIDAAVGWPKWLHARVGHPVAWIGRVISACDNALNSGSHGQRLIKGTATVAIGLIAATVPAGLIQVSLPGGPAGPVIGGMLAWPLIAARSMHDHVVAVAAPLTSGEMGTARQAVSMIVGRDPTRLEAEGIARAATESLAENTSDGVVAPIFWGLLAGLPGLAAYKAINTMDSMIGYRTDRYEAFGKAAARLDDAVNLIPARITGLLFALAALHRFSSAIGTMRRDAAAHRSPNAGWPEAAVAGALGVRLSGPRTYGDQATDDPWVNAGAPDPTPDDLWRALSLFRRTVALLALALAALVLL